MLSRRRVRTANDGTGVTSYAYDAGGNQTTIETPAGDVTTQVWSYENKLVGYESPRAT